ncbi:MAG: flagellar transcriptional regulator FlhD [Burkholderiales bacterium]|nr:flagellar transcriptional regulator FlhD [Burkholderiales bacterium]
MDNSQLLNEIRETNLTYLLLAQRMIKDDKVAALFRLGIAKDAAELIESLTPAQMLKIAAGNMLLCRFRFDNRVLGDMLCGYVKDKIMASSHAAVLMAGEKAEPIAA